MAFFDDLFLYIGGACSHMWRYSSRRMLGLGCALLVVALVLGVGKTVFKWKPIKALRSEAYDPLSDVFVAHTVAEPADARSEPSEGEQHDMPFEQPMSDTDSDDNSDWGDF